MLKYSKILHELINLALQKKLEDSGAKISNSISKNTHYLIVKDQDTIDNNTGKVKKAKDLEVKIITLANLEKLLKN
jgi:NAD-dependent DNA ligase